MEPSWSDMDDTTSSNSDSTVDTDCIVEHPSHHPIFEKYSTEGSDVDLPTIHVLNDDCMYLVLEYLDIVEVMRLATVCRRWYNLCLNKMSIVSKIELSPTFSIFRLNRSLSQSNFISILALTANNLTHLDVSHSSLKLDWASCKAISELCPNLEVLNLSKKKISNKVASCFTKFLPPKLQSLVLNGCVSFRDKYLENMLKNAGQLTQLDLSYNHKISCGSITKYLGENKMTHFTFTECYKLKPLVVQFVLSNFEDSLQHLDLSLCHSKVFDISTDQCPVLRELKVFKNKAIEGRCYTPTSGNLEKFLRIMPNLEVLDLENNTNAGLDNFVELIARLCPKLKYLNISACAPQTTQSLSALSYFENLETLYLNDLPKRLDYKDLTDSTLVKCLNLQYLALQSCSIDDECVFSLISKLDKLHTLDLRSCIMPLDGSFVYLCQELNRQLPLKIFAQDTVMQEEEFNLIPAFLNIKFGLPNFQDDEFFGGVVDEWDGVDEFEQDWVDEFDAGFGGGYVDEAGQFNPPFGYRDYLEYEFHDDDADDQDDAEWW